MSGRDPSAVDPKAIIRTAAYRRLLLLACLTGFVISLAAWAFLTLVPWIQDRVYIDLPKAFGFSEAPSWWPLPVLAIAGFITAFAIVRLPGRGGRVPAEGFAPSLVEPANLPGILLAGLSALGLGLVLGPSMPVIALGSGLAVLAIRTARSDAPDTTIMVMSAAGSCASLAMIFGSPVISALILIEAAGLGGPTLPLILLPALLSAGIGSLVYLGMGQLTGLSTSAYALNPLDLPAMPQLTVVDFLWTLVVAVLAAVATFAIVQLARRVARPAHARPFVLVPLAALLVAGLAITYAQVGGDTPYAVLFSGSRALKPVIDQAETFSVGTLALLLACKGLAWGVSMGSFRGGPVFPAIFVGTVGGLLASHLPGFPEGAAVATVMAATVAAVLRLPLSSVVIALTMSSSAGADASPLIIVAAAVSYIIVDVLEGRQGRSPADAPTAAGAASTPTPPTDGQPTVSIAPRASSRSG